MLHRKLLDAPGLLAVAHALGYTTRMSRVLLMPLLLLLAAPAPAFAAGANPCRDDVARLCSGVTPGEGRIRDCLRAHATEISPACRGWAASARWAAQRSGPGGLDARRTVACRGDIDRFCSGIPSGGGRWRRCLGDHAAELSDGCRAALDASAAPPGTPKK